MKKVLILGVNGFIGHHLSKRIMDTTDWEDHGKLYADLFIASANDDVDLLMNKMIATHVAVSSGSLHYGE